MSSKWNHEHICLVRRVFANTQQYDQFSFNDNSFAIYQPALPFTMLFSCSDMSILHQAGTGKYQHFDSWLWNMRTGSKKQEVGASKNILTKMNIC